MQRYQLHICMLASRCLRHTRQVAVRNLLWLQLQRVPLRRPVWIALTVMVLWG